MKRDLITEIHTIKSRSSMTSTVDYVYQLGSIEAALDRLVSASDLSDGELLQYIPIATVACFEAFFTTVVKELIDSGEPFNKNVSNFNQAKNIKIDFDVLSAIQTETVTVGEFVAHLLPYNNLADISSNLTVIIGCDFLTALKAFKKESIFDSNNLICEQFSARSGEIIESVKKIYELRHIFCHEFGTNISIDKTAIKGLFSDCKVFLEYSSNFVWELLYPNSPESQSDMNAHALSEYQQSQSILDQLLIEIEMTQEHATDMDYFDHEEFLRSMKYWEQYRESYARYSASCVEGGSMYPLLYASAMKEKTLEKIKSLKNDFNHLLVESGKRG